MLLGSNILSTHHRSRFDSARRSEEANTCRATLFRL